MIQTAIRCTHASVKKVRSPVQSLASAYGGSQCVSVRVLRRLDTKILGFCLRITVRMQSTMKKLKSGKQHFREADNMQIWIWHVTTIRELEAYRQSQHLSQCTKYPPPSLAARALPTPHSALKLSTCICSWLAHVQHSKQQCTTVTTKIGSLGSVGSLGFLGSTDA